MVVLATIAVIEAQEGNAAGHGGGAGNTYLEGGAGIKQEGGVVPKIKLVVDVDGHVQSEFTVAAGHIIVGPGCAAGGSFTVNQHIQVETGSHTQTGHDGHVVAGTQIETVMGDGVRVTRLFRSEEITGTRDDLCVGLGADEQQGCCEKGCKNLFHNIG